MRLIAKVLVFCAAIATIPLWALALRSDKNEPLAVALLGQAAKEFSQDQSVTGALSTQQICSRPLSSVVNLSPSGSFVSVFQSPEFEPKLDDAKSIELLKVQSALRGLGIMNVTPLGWARTADEYYFRKLGGGVFKIDPQTLLTEEIQTLADQINRFWRSRQFLGGHAGYVIFGPQVFDNNLVLVDMERPSKIIRIPTDFAKISKASISCGENSMIADTCTVTVMMRDTVNETPLAKGEAQVQIARISTFEGQVVSQQKLRSPNLVAADYVGQFSNGVAIWLGYGGETRNLFLVGQAGVVKELASPIGDIKEAFLSANNTLVIENFFHQIAKISKFNPSQISDEIKPGWIEVGQQLPAQGPSGLRLINLAENSAHERSGRSSGAYLQTSFGCGSSGPKHTWVPLGRSGYFEFLPDTGKPRGLLVYLHGGPYSRSAPEPSNIVQPWLAMGYKVWALEHPGTPGFGLSNFLPTRDLIKEDAESLVKRIQLEQASLDINIKQKFSTIFMGNSFGGFALIQLSSILRQSRNTAFVLVNTPCKNYANMPSARGEPIRYGHVKAVGSAYQELGMLNGVGTELCAVQGVAPVFVFASENDEVVSQQNAIRIANASASKVVVLKNETHTISVAGAEMIAEEVLRQANKQ